MTARRYRVEGRVQGVGFRAYVVRAGRAAGVRGAVRNDSDGAVTAVAEGDDRALGEFRLALSRGPSHASVRSVTESEGGAGAGERFDASF